MSHGYQLLRVVFELPIHAVVIHAGVEVAWNADFNLAGAAPWNAAALHGDR